jgi:RNA polymerase sigma factor (sigma-70 family)
MEEDRKDLFQEIVYQLWKSYPTFQNKAEFSTWMYRVALNTALLRVRKRTKDAQITSLQDSDLDIPDKPATRISKTTSVNCSEPSTDLTSLSDPSSCSTWTGNPMQRFQGSPD